MLSATPPRTTPTPNADSIQLSWSAPPPKCFLTRRGRREKAGFTAKLISIAIPMIQRSPFHRQT